MNSTLSTLKNRAGLIKNVDGGSLVAIGFLFNTFCFSFAGLLGIICFLFENFCSPFALFLSVSVEA
jgi:hypothetical protein